MNVQKSSLYQPFNNYQRSNEENFEEIVTKGGNKVFKVNIPLNSAYERGGSRHRILPPSV